MQSKFVFMLAYLALEIIAGGVWPGEGYAASIDQQLGLARQQVYEAEHSPSADLQALRSKLQVARKRVDEVLTQHPQHTQALALAGRIDTLLKQLAPPVLGGHPYEKEAEVTADRLAGLIKSGGKRTEIESLHTHLRRLIQRLPREKSSIAAAYKVRAQALWQLYKPSLVRVTDACAKCPALNLTTLVPEYARPRLLGVGDYTLLDLKEMGKQGYTTLVTGDFNRDGRDDVALVGKNEQETGSDLFFLIVALDNKGGYRRLLFEKPDWDKAALAGYKGKLTLTENFSHQTIYGKSPGTVKNLFFAMPASTHNIIFGGLNQDPRGIIKATLWLIIATYLMAQPEWGAAADRRARLADKPQAFANANGHLSPTAFEFVVPGVRRGEVDKRLGKPYISSTSVVLQGEIDLFLNDAPTEQSDPPRAPQPTEEVRYYDYRPDKFPSEHARIVFRGDKIWYAMLPPLHGEKTRAEIMARYGHVFEEQKVHRRDGHILSVDVILWLSKKGLAFVEKPGRGITYRVVFPAGDLTATRKRGLM